MWFARLLTVWSNRSMRLPNGLFSPENQQRKGEEGEEGEEEKEEEEGEGIPTIKKTHTNKFGKSSR